MVFGEREGGRGDRCSGTHILKDFELQRSSIQVKEFPCKNKAEIREGSALPGGCFQAPPLPLLRLHPCFSSGSTPALLKAPPLTLRLRPYLASGSTRPPRTPTCFPSVIWVLPCVITHLSGPAHSRDLALPLQDRPYPIDLPEFGPHHTVAGSFGHGRCTPSHPFDLQRHPLTCSEQLQACAAAGPAPSAGLPEPRGRPSGQHDLAVQCHYLTPLLSSNKSLLGPP